MASTVRLRGTWWSLDEDGSTNNLDHTGDHKQAAGLLHEATSRAKGFAGAVLALFFGTVGLTI